MIIKIIGLKDEKGEMLVGVMSRSRLERLYEERGIADYKISTLDDLFYIYGVKLNQIEGYFKLADEERIFFNKFVINYFNSQDLESRNICILKVIKINGYLRVEFISNGEWRVGCLELGIEN
jgi:hypothetical protein